MIDRLMTTCPIHNEQHEAEWPCLQCEDEAILEFHGTPMSLKTYICFDCSRVHSSKVETCDCGGCDIAFFERLPYFTLVCDKHQYISFHRFPCKACLNNEPKVTYEKMSF